MTRHQGGDKKGPKRIERVNECKRASVRVVRVCVRCEEGVVGHCMLSLMDGSVGMCSLSQEALRGKAEWSTSLPSAGKHWAHPPSTTALLLLLFTRRMSFSQWSRGGCRSPDSCIYHVTQSVTFGDHT